jgi:thiol-disulfide isomerase/thioredoxin
VEAGEGGLGRGAGTPAARRAAGTAVSLLAGLLLVCLITAGCGSRSTDQQAVVPALVEADLAAVEQRLAGGGGRRVVNFWATWCKPCVEEIPELVALDAAHRDDGVRVIGISLDPAVPGQGTETAARVRDFLLTNGITYENLLYTERISDLLDALDLPGTLPYTLVVGDDGEVRWRHEGRVRREEIEAVLALLPPGGRAAGE